MYIFSLFFFRILKNCKPDSFSNDILNKNYYYYKITIIIIIIIIIIIGTLFLFPNNFLPEYDHDMI